MLDQTENKDKEKTSLQRALQALKTVMEISFKPRHLIKERAPAPNDS